jgi:hypothetical protein
MIWSYTEKNDFSDCYYFGEIKQMHYTELKKIKPDISDEELKRFSNLEAHGIMLFQLYINYQDDYSLKR